MAITNGETALVPAKTYTRLSIFVEAGVSKRLGVSKARGRHTHHDVYAAQLAPRLDTHS